MTQLSIINITMSSIDVAKLTEKEHRNVMADIRKLEEYYQEIYSAEKSAELINQQLIKILFKEPIRVMSFLRRLFLTL